MSSKKKRILVSTGIKSEYDIIYPVLLELQSNGHEVLIAVSGAHLSDHHNSTMERIVEDGFCVAERIDTLFSTERVVQRSKGTGILIQGLTQTVERINPDMIMVVGDREESIAAAVVGNYMEKLLVHIGGGDPVYGNSDDPIRFAVSKLAHIHCCSAQEYCENLLSIGEESFRIFQTGNPAFVNIEHTPVIDRAEIAKKMGLNSSDVSYVVLIKHPLSSEVQSIYEQILFTLKSLERFCEKHDFQTICIPPNSDPGSEIIRDIIEEYSSKNWFHPAQTLNRLDFVNTMRYAKALIGNSSMGILEAPYYKLPVVNVGNRQKGRLNAGNVEFVPYDTEMIISAVEKACFDEKYREKVRGLINPYGDDTAAQKVREAIESVDLEDRRWYVKERLCP